MPRDSEGRRSRRRSSADKIKAESSSSLRIQHQRAQHKSSPDKSGSGRRSNRHECDDDRRRRRRHEEDSDTGGSDREEERRRSRRRDSTTRRRSEEHVQERRSRKSRRRRRRRRKHGSKSSYSSDESDCSSSSATSASSLSDHPDDDRHHQDKKQPKEEDEASLDSAYVYVVDGDEREVEKNEDEDTSSRRHRRDHRRHRRSRRKSHGHRKDSTHRRRRRRSSANITLDSTRSSEDAGEADAAANATARTVEGKDIAQEIIERRHLELELIDVREQLAWALADKMRLERKAAKLDKTAKILYRENQELKNLLADPRRGERGGNKQIPSMVHEGDGQRIEMHAEKKSSSPTKHPQRRSSLAGYPYADGNGSLSSAAFDMLHASQEARAQVQKLQRRHSMTSAGTGAYNQQDQLIEHQVSSPSMLPEIIPLSVLKTPPPECYKISSLGETKNRARLLSRSQSGIVAYDKTSTHPPVTNVVMVERQRTSTERTASSSKSNAGGTGTTSSIGRSSSKKKMMKMEKSKSERGLRLDSDLPVVDPQNGRKDHKQMTKKAQAMKKAVSERLLFRSAPSNAAKAKE